MGESGCLGEECTVPTLSLVQRRLTLRSLTRDRWDREARARGVRERPQRQTR